ncbi:MAG: hypothetical protein AABX72_03535 [Nanoarchaeota archaeon]
MKQILRFFLAISFTLILSAFFVLAVIYTDTTFVPVSSTECGNQYNNCGIAVATSALVGLNDPNVGTNITAVSDELESITPENDDTTGTHLDNLTHAIAVTWGS